MLIKKNENQKIIKKKSRRIYERCLQERNVTINFIK